MVGMGVMIFGRVGEMVEQIFLIGSRLLSIGGRGSSELLPLEVRGLLLRW